MELMRYLNRQTGIIIGVKPSSDFLARVKQERNYPFVPNLMKIEILSALPNNEDEVSLGSHGRSTSVQNLLAINTAGNLSLVVNDNGVVNFLIPGDKNPALSNGDTIFRNAS